MIPQNYFDLSVSHQVNLLRRANGIVKDVLDLLIEAENDIKYQIIKIDPTGVRKSYQEARLEKLLEAVQERIADVKERMRDSIRSELQGLTKYEASNQAQMLKNVIPIEIAVNVPPAEALVAIVNSTPIEGRFFKDWIDIWEKASVDAMNQAIRIGVLEGETQSQIVRRVVEAGQVRRNAATQLVRTGVTHVTNEARQLTWANNTDIVTGWTFVATLDSRTTLTCASLHGTSYPIGEGPRPPRHRNCRSTTVSTLKSWRDLGVDIDEFSPGMQSSMNGVVPSDITFTTWLKSQSAATQKEILGASRYKLFKTGKINVDYFTDSQGNTLTLDQLRKKDSDLFDAAGL